jgi:hypothetical protein
MVQAALGIKQDPISKVTSAKRKRSTSPKRTQIDE